MVHGNTWPKIAVASWLASGLCAQQECRPCHPREVERHARSNHASTLRRAAETEFARSLPPGPIGEARDGFLLSYEQSGDGLTVTAARGRQRAQARIEWAFGAAGQGVTPVARIGDRWLEHRISYYSGPGKFDLTLGHRPGPSRSAEAAIGIAQPEATIRSCFGCHSSVSAGELRVEQPGVVCERCHGGAAAHALGRGAPVNPAKLSARAQVELCAVCHRLAPPKEQEDDPLNIRFQPLRLVKSRCYLAGELKCLTCHPANQNARRADPAFYREKCLSCHPSQANKADCLPCHMPKSSPAPYLAFTDHYIRRR